MQKLNALEQQAHVVLQVVMVIQHQHAQLVVEMEQKAIHVLAKILYANHVKLVYKHVVDHSQIMELQVANADMETITTLIHAIVVDIQCLMHLAIMDL